MKKKDLILIELVAYDDIGMYQLDSNPEVHKYLGNKPVTNIEECQQVIEMVRKQYIENGIGRWAMIEKSSGDFISWSLLKYMKEPINHHVNFYEVGYRLRQEFLGKGFATEYTKASLKYAFEVLNSQEVYDIYPY